MFSRDTFLPLVLVVPLGYHGTTPKPVPKTSLLTGTRSLDLVSISGLLLVSQSHQIMTNTNPYVANLIEMGYDAQDCYNVASVGIDSTYPRTIHGKIFETKEEYDDAISDFLNGL